MILHLVIAGLGLAAGPWQCEEAPADIPELLNSVGASKHTHVFDEHELRLGDLEHLTDAHWRELNLPIGPRARLRRAVAHLRSCSVDANAHEGDDSAGEGGVTGGSSAAAELGEVVDELPMLDQADEEAAFTGAILDGAAEIEVDAPPAAEPAAGGESGGSGAAAAEPQPEPRPGAEAEAEPTPATGDSDSGGWLSWVWGLVGWSGGSSVAANSAGAGGALPAAPARGCDFDRMIQWIRSEGGDVDHRLQVTSLGGGERGVQVTGKVDAGTWLMSVPPELTIKAAENLQDADESRPWQGVLGGSLRSQRRVMWVEEVRVAVQLLVERRRLLNGDGSAFAPYIECLPPPTFCPLPLCATPAELSKLGGADIETFTGIIGRLGQVYERVRWPSILSPPPTLQEFVWAVATVASRAGMVAVTGPEADTLALLPLLDMVSHASSGRGSPFFAHPRRPGYTLKRASRALEKGDEVFGQYVFQRSNRDMLLLFGFILPDTDDNAEHQFYQMQTTLDYGDPMQRGRARDLLHGIVDSTDQVGQTHQLEITEQPGETSTKHRLQIDFCLERDNIPAATMALFRFLAAQGRAHFTSSGQLAEAISPALERDALRLMHQALDSIQLPEGEDELLLQGQLEDARKAVASTVQARGEHGAADEVNLTDAQADAAAGAARRNMHLLEFRLFRIRLVAGMRAQVDSALQRLELLE